MSPSKEQPPPAPLQTEGVFALERRAEDALLWCYRLLGTEQRRGCLEIRSYAHCRDAERGRDLDISSVPLNNPRSAGQVHSSSLSEGKEQILSGLDSRCGGSAAMQGTACLGSGRPWPLLLTGACSSTCVCTDSCLHKDVCTHRPAPPRSITGCGTHQS